MKKRLFAAMLAVLMCLPACSNAPAEEEKPDSAAVSAENAEEAAEEEEQPSALESLGEKDYEGRNYTIFDANYYAYMHINIPGEELTGDVLNDALLNREMVIEDRYNVEIGYTQTTIEPFINSMLAGETIYHFLISALTTLNDCANRGILYDLCDLPHMEPAEKWWSEKFYNSLRLRDTMYYTIGDIAPAVYQTPACLFLNLKLYDEYGVEGVLGGDIYQYVLDGKWTFDELSRVTKDLDQDLNSDSVMDAKTDFFGVAYQAGTSHPISAFLLGAGVPYCSITEDGTNLVFDAVSNERLYNAVDKLKGFLHECRWSDIQDVIAYTFREDRALFLLHTLQSAANELREMESDYLILPCPKYDELQDTYISFVNPYACGYVSVPKVLEDEDFTGFITEALARYSYETLRPVAFDLFYKEKVSRDPRTSDVLDVLLDNLYVDFCTVFNFGSVLDTISGAIANDTPLTSSLEKNAKVIGKTIEKMVSGWAPEG